VLAEGALGGGEDFDDAQAFGGAGARGGGAVYAVDEVAALDGERLGQVEMRDVYVALAHGQVFTILSKLRRAAVLVAESLVVDAQLLGRVGVVKLNHALAADDSQAPLLAR